MSTLDDLRKEINEEKVIIITGSGVTASLTGNQQEATWSGLVRKGAEVISETNQTEGQALLNRINTDGNLEILASEIKEKLSADNKFNQFITQTIGKLELKDDSLAEALRTLRCPIFTTNYDIVLDDALQRPPVSWKQPSMFRDILHGRRRGIGHIHGVWSEPNDIIFSAQDYGKIKSDTAMQSFLTSILTTHTILFIGMGLGMHDSNFKPQMDKIFTQYPSSLSRHYRLCLSSEQSPDSFASTVSDIPYGDQYAELANFLNDLKPTKTVALRSALALSSRKEIADAISESNVIQRDVDLAEVSNLENMIVKPVFLEQSHDEYVWSLPDDILNDSPKILAENTLLDTNVPVAIVVGEEKSGLTTSLRYLLYSAMTHDPGTHGVYLRHIRKYGKNTLKKQLDRKYNAWNATENKYREYDKCYVAIDDFGQTDTRHLCDEIRSLPIRKLFVGCRMTDLPYLRSHFAGVGMVTIAHLGRFSEDQVDGMIRLIHGSPDPATRGRAMRAIYENRLPRTPFTVAVICELLINGQLDNEANSNWSLIGRFIEYLVDDSIHPYSTSTPISSRHLFRVLEHLATNFTIERSAALDAAFCTQQISSLFQTLGWPYSARQCLELLVKRRVLKDETNDCISFRQSSYLYYFAGLAACHDPGFRSAVFSDFRALLPIILSYCSHKHDDSEAVKRITRILKEEASQDSSALAFSEYESLQLKSIDSDLSEDDYERLSYAQNGPGTQKGEVYIPLPDSDITPFSTALDSSPSTATRLMYVTEAASRILKVSDMVPDQSLKDEAAYECLRAWSCLIAHLEEEFCALDNLRMSIEAAVGAKTEDSNDTEHALFFIQRILPLFLVAAGIRSSLSDPSLDIRLRELGARTKDEEWERVSLLRIVALMSAPCAVWTPLLKELSQKQIQTFFSSEFLFYLIEVRYICDSSLDDVSKGHMKDYMLSIVQKEHRGSTGVARRHYVSSKYISNIDRRRALYQSRHPNGTDDIFI